MVSQIDEFLPPRALWPDLVVPPQFEGLPRELNLAEELLDWHIREGRSDRTAIYFEDQRITYGEIADQANRLGSSLLRIGVAPKDRVAIRMTTIPQANVAIFATLKIGAIPVPISPLWSRNEVRHVGQDALLKAIVVCRSLLGEVDAVKEEIPSLAAIIVVDDTNEDRVIQGRRYYAFEDLIRSGSDRLDPFRVKKDDVAILLYTSGTTGLPKGCAHTALGVLIHSRLISTY